MSRNSPQANKKSALKRRLGGKESQRDSGHDHRNKGQQKNQYTAANGQHDGHQGHDGFNRVLFFAVMGL